MVGAEAGQHIGVTIKNMNTNELIANALSKSIQFGTANIDADSSDTEVAEGAGYVDGGDNTLKQDMLEKFYTFEYGAKGEKVVDTDVWTDAGNNTTAAITGVDKDAAPTAADYAALNAFAKSAIQDVSKQRSDLGAVQNRLEHTIANLDNIVENTSSAEAEIRDTDIATEMVQYANNNILQQAGTSMLSQANQSNQLALSLLG